MLLHQDIKIYWKREASACQQELHQPSSQEYLTLAPRVSSQAWASHHAACLPHLSQTTRRKHPFWSRFTGSISHQAARRMAPRLYVAIFRDGFQTILTSFGTVKTTIAVWCAGQPWVKSRKLSLTLVLWGSSAPASMSRYRLHLWHVVHAPLKTWDDFIKYWKIAGWADLMSWKWRNTYLTDMHWSYIPISSSIICYHTISIHIIWYHVSMVVQHVCIIRNLY